MRHAAYVRFIATAAALTTLAAPLAVAQTEAAKPAKERSGEELYKTVCSACHEKGVSGAPKFGDKKAWAPLIKEGMEVLLRDSIAGIRAMPPRGGSNASDKEMARAIAYMANKAGGNFKAP